MSAGVSTNAVGPQTKHSGAKSVTSNATIAALTALWGLLATVTSARTAIAVAGLLVLTTPLLLPRRDRTEKHEHEPVPSHT